MKRDWWAKMQYWSVRTDNSSILPPWFHLGTSHPLSIYLIWHIEAMTKRPPLCRWHFQFTFKFTSLFENSCVSIWISLNFVSSGRINSISSLVQTIAWPLTDNKPWSEVKIWRIYASLNLANLVFVRGIGGNQTGRPAIFIIRSTWEKAVYRPPLQVEFGFGFRAVAWWC